jgi:hypothetical protein
MRIATTVHAHGRLFHLAQLRCIDRRNRQPDIAPGTNVAHYIICFVLHPDAPQQSRLFHPRLNAVNGVEWAINVNFHPAALGLT